MHGCVVKDVGAFGHTQEACRLLKRFGSHAGHTFDGIARREVAVGGTERNDIGREGVADA